MNNPWNVEDSAEGRTTLLKLVEEYEQSGQLRELGLTLTRLARLAKQIGMGEEGNGFVASAIYADRAVEVLRQTDDQMALAAALRAAAVPLVTGIEPVTLLKEALQISRSIGDTEGEGWAIFTLANSFFMHPHGYKLEDAEEKFRTAGSKRGLATCLQSQAIKGREGRWEKLLQAADLFEEAGLLQSALRAIQMACSIDFEEKGIDVRREALDRALTLSRLMGDAKEEAFTYRLLRNLYLESDPELAYNYAALEDSLDTRVYGSRAGRLRYELEGQHELLEFASRREKKAIKAEIARIEAELRTLE